MATFKKSEKLSSQILIEKVYKEGETIKSFPIMLKVLELDQELPAPVQIVFSIPKRKIKRAVDRNRIRRQLREIYRLNKTGLLEIIKNKNKNLAIFVLYMSNQKEDYQKLEEKLNLTLQQVIAKYQ